MLFRRCLSTVETVAIRDPHYCIPNNSIIFSGIQPTGQFHLGNYFGAVKNWSDLQHKIVKDQSNASLFFFTADLHSLTVPQDYQLLKRQRREAFASIIACGVDPEHATIYQQSQVPEITKLAWILGCFTSMGYLNRMTQWKSKANLNDNDLGKVKLGLFSYPVLMAADVLSVNATHVPVGQDQSQHLELTRELAETFNKVAGVEYFNVPKTLLTPTKKILSLKNPKKKMSKSDKEPLSKIFITDSKELIRTKFNKAITDSIEGPITFDFEKRPAVANLISILAACEGASTDKVTKDVSNFTKKELKEAVANAVNRELEEPRRKYKELIENGTMLQKICARGAEKAREKVNKTCNEVSELVGMGY